MGVNLELILTLITSALINTHTAVLVELLELLLMRLDLSIRLETRKGRLSSVVDRWNAEERKGSTKSTHNITGHGGTL